MLRPRGNAYLRFAGSWLFATLLAVLWPTANAPTAAHASLGDCAQPVTNDDGPSATDCLYVFLQAAVGLVTCSPECICAPKGSLPAAATDALLCLAAATGRPVTLDSPCATSSTTTTTLYSPADCGAFESKLGAGKLDTPYGIELAPIS
jgi:hypothetical protein